MQRPPIVHSGRENCCTSAAEEDGPARGPNAPLGEDKLRHKCQQNKMGHAEAPVLHPGRANCCTKASRRRRAFQRPQCSTRGGQTAAQVLAEEDWPCRGPSAPLEEDKLRHKCQQKKMGLPEAPLLHSGRENCCTSAAEEDGPARGPNAPLGEDKLLHKCPQKGVGHAEAPVLHSGRTNCCTSAAKMMGLP